MVGGHRALGDAQLLLQDRSVGRLTPLGRVAAPLLLLAAELCRSQLILEGSSSLEVVLNKQVR